MEHQGPQQHFVGSWVGLGGPRCVVGNAAMVALRFTEVYSYFGCLADLPLCVQAWAVVPHLQLQSQILGWGRIWGFCQPCSGCTDVSSSKCSCHCWAGLSVASWDGASLGTSLFPSFPQRAPWPEGGILSGERTSVKRDVVVFLERLENWISPPLKTLVSAIYLLSYF